VAEATDAALDGERKTITAMFADIKGSMELMEDLDPEEARSIVDPALKLMIDAVHRYEGYIVQSTGDGVFALFGAPIAHEDHPQRAIYAAFRIQDEMRRYSAKLREQGNPPIEARVGINTGEAVVRMIKTGEAHTEYTPIGHSTSLAARMQTLAPTGSIAVTEATEKLCAGYFTFKGLGPTRVKGVTEPINVFEATGLGPLRSRLQRSAGRGLTKFVGREREMESLKHAGELATQGHGQIVAAIAEAGTGKSRLFFEFKAKNQSGWAVLEAFSVSHGKASAYFPVIDLLHSYFKITGEDHQRARRAKITGNVLTLDRALEDTLPYLFALLGVPEENNPLEGMDGQIRRRRTLDAIKRLVLRESLNQPLMVVFEDLHWIDEETQALLNLLADSIGTAKILLLVNYRPEYSHHWGNKTYYTQLRLDPLGRESAEEMLASLLGDGSDLTALKRVIIEKTGGNPFFMEETYQVLLDEGALVRNGAVKLTKPLNQLKIPPTVQAILASRIDRLPPDEKSMLQTLAVIGKEFPLSLVREIVDGPDEKLNRMLNDLQLAEFIYEQPAVSDTEYTFKHALTQEVAYNSVLAERRRGVHERAAQAIEKLYRESLEDHYGELARHYLVGEDANKALHFARLAIEQALGRSAYSETQNLIEAGLRTIDKLKDERAGLKEELWLRTTESTVEFALHGASSHQREHAIRRMCELAEKIGDQEQLLRGRVNLCNLYFTQGEAARGLELGRKCLRLAEVTKDASLLADAHWALGSSAHTSGEFAEAVMHYEEATRLAEKAGPGGSLWGIRFVSGPLSQECSVLQILGHSDRAAAASEEALRRARETGHLFTLGHALTTAVGWVTQVHNDPERMLIHAEEQIAFSTEHDGLVEWLHWGHIYRGNAMTERGRHEEGISEMEAGIAAFRRAGNAPMLQFAIALLGVAYARQGRLEEAMKILDDVLAHIGRSGEKCCLAEILRLRGEVTLIRDQANTVEAERYFRESLEIARAQSARWWELRTATSLARLLRDTDRRDEARAQLTDIYNWFTEGFNTADLKGAKALLDDLRS
jgi:class 3 adenylate cyclase/tetratricopeptide (TPR) repeat protein